MRYPTKIGVCIFSLFSLISQANVETHHLPQEWCNQLAYNVSVPVSYDSRMDWPLMLYFHGHGGQVTNIEQSSDLGNWSPIDLQGNDVSIANDKIEIDVDVATDKKFFRFSPSK